MLFIASYTSHFVETCIFRQMLPEMILNLQDYSRNIIKFYVCVYNGRNQNKQHIGG